MEVMIGAKTNAPPITPDTTPARNPIVGLLLHFGISHAPAIKAIVPTSTAPSDVPCQGNLIPAGGGPSQEKMICTKKPSTLPTEMPAANRPIGELIGVDSFIRGPCCPMAIANWLFYNDHNGVAYH